MTRKRCDDCPCWGRAFDLRERRGILYVGVVRVPGPVTFVGFAIGKLYVGALVNSGLVVGAWWA